MTAADTNRFLPSHWALRAFGTGLAALVVLAVCAISPAAVAQVLDEIVVTAQKRPESVQDVPISISAFRGEDLENMGVRDLTELSAFVPSFSIDQSNNLRNTTISIRGIGTTGANPSIEPSVGLFVDGVFMPASAMSAGELSDIATVEVLRGPQGTLYGRNTPVGALNITTRRPDHDFEAMLRGGAGNFSHRWISGYVGGSVTDESAGRVTFWYRDRDGYLNNDFDGSRVNDSTDYGVRGRLLFAPSDAVEVNLVAYASRLKSDCCFAEQRDATGPFGIATPGFLAAMEAAGAPFTNFDDSDHRVDAAENSDDQTKSWGISAQVDWTLPTGQTITSITSYQDWENDAEIANASLPLHALVSDQKLTNETISQELRVAAAVNDRIHYTAGLFYFRQDMDFDLITQPQDAANRLFPPPVCGFNPPCMLREGDVATSVFEQKTRNIAAFGSITFAFSDAWDVTGGLRWSQDKKDAFIDHFLNPDASATAAFVFSPVTPGDLSRKESNVIWSLNSRYRFTDEVMGFATVATGIKSGGFNSRRLPPGATVEFEEEESISYELGLKATWLDRRLLTNATAFWLELDDFQETTLDPNTGVGFIVGNAGDRRVRGLELEVTALPSPNLQVGFSGAYMDAEFTDYTTAQCGAGQTPDGALPGTCDFTGKRPSKSPRWKWSANGQWTQPLAGTGLDWMIRADYAWVSSQVHASTLDAASGQSSYGVLNLRTSLVAQERGWELALWMKNAFDKAYFVHSVPQPVNAFFSGGGFAGAQGFVGWYGLPRSYGLELTWRAR